MLYVSHCVLTGWWHGPENRDRCRISQRLSRTELSGMCGDTTPLLAVRRNEAFQLLEPIEHNVDFKRCGSVWLLDHQEPPIGCDIIIEISGSLILSLEQFPKIGCPEIRLGLNGCGHHRLAVEIEQLPTDLRPHGLTAAIGRNLDLWAWAGIRLHINLPPAGLIRAVGDPSAVG